MVKSPLKGHGTKSRMANMLINLMPKEGVIHRVETHCLTAAFTLACDPNGVSEVINDINLDVTNFWKVLQSQNSFSEFKRLCEATPFSEIEWDDVDVGMADWPEPDEMEATPSVRAWRFFIHCRQSLAGRCDSFAPLSRRRTRRGMNEQAAAWLAAIEGLPEVHERLKRVVILSQDALEVIRTQDGDGTFFYVDPPYYPDTRESPDVYDNEMTVDDHCRLLSSLAKINGRFMLSGYANPAYDSFAETHRWRRVDFDRANSAAGGKSKRRMTESVWMNYEG